MSEKRVKVITRARTMSGYRGGLTLALLPDEAERMIKQGWADPVPSEDTKGTRQKEGRDAVPPRVSQPSGKYQY